MTPDKNTKVLVDTTLFIDFFRGRKVEAFEQLLLENRIYLSHYVHLELLQGVRKNELTRLNYVLGGLETVPFQEDLFERAEAMLFRLKSSGLILGIVDLLIAVEASGVGCPIYSKDGIFEKLSQLGLVQRFIPGPGLRE